MPRILVVEDDPAILKGLLDALEQEGHTVISTRNGQQGLELGLREEIDLVILDIMLPGLDGYQICKKLREDNLGVPIMMLSARSREADKVVGLEFGADDYVTKPFGVAELLARVKALLRRLNREDNRKLRSYAFGEVNLDFEKFRATRAGKPLLLTAREFAILGHFIRHRGKVVTREELLTSVWHHEAPPETRTVDTHMGQLRKKIERVASKPRFLVSVRGAGYRFEG
jgi:DNA-binding response OmpR family regulator